MKTRIPLLIVLFLFAATATAQKDVKPPLASLIAVERAFAQTAATKGIRDSFLSYIADDGIIFRPHAVVGKKWLMENPPSPGLLSWEPAFADISISGDLGYTTGPSEFREKSPDDQPTRCGHFVTVWKKQADGDWKFVIDLGINHPQPAPKPSSVQSPLPLRKVGQKVNVEAERAVLLEVDRKFSQALTARGMREAFLSFLADNGRLYRPGAFPFVGPGAIYTALSAQPGVLTSQPAKADVANAGDLGYTYGTYEFKEKDAGDKPASRGGFAQKAPVSIDSSRSETPSFNHLAGFLCKASRGNYLRIWKKQSDGRWKIVLDIANLLPPSTTTS